MKIAIENIPRGISSLNQLRVLCTAHEIKTQEQQVPSITQIGKKVDISPAAMTQIIDQMADGGFITRVHVEDRRKRLISLTAEGERAMEQMTQEEVAA